MDIVSKNDSINSNFNWNEQDLAFLLESDSSDLFFESTSSAHLNAVQPIKQTQQFTIESNTSEQQTIHSENLKTSNLISNVISTSTPSEAQNHQNKCRIYIPSVPSNEGRR